MIRVYYRMNHRRDTFKETLLAFVDQMVHNPSLPRIGETVRLKGQDGKTSNYTVADVEWNITHNSMEFDVTVWLNGPNY